MRVMNDNELFALFWIAVVAAIAILAFAFTYSQRTELEYQLQLTCMETYSLEECRRDE